ncbi:MAG: DMT family transporter [Bdellovibrionota bacterium]
MKVNLKKLQTENAILNILLSTLFFAFMNVVVKYLKDIPFFELVFFRATISCIIGYFTLKQMKISFKPSNPKMILLRGITGTISLMLFFYTLQRMPLTTAVTIQYLAPLFTAILAGFILNEKTTWLQWFFLLFSFLGVMMVKGFDYRISWIELGLGITAAFMSGLTYNLIRKLKDQEPPIRIVFYFPMVSAIISFPFLFTEIGGGWVTPDFRQSLLFLFLGIVTWFAQLFMTKAYQADAPGYISIFNYLGIFLGAGFGYIFFDETLTVLASFGILIILVSVVLSTLYQNYIKRKGKYVGKLTR